MNFSGILLHSPDIRVCQPRVYGSGSSEENVETNVCDEEHEDRRKDGLVTYQIEHSTSGSIKDIEDINN